MERSEIAAPAHIPVECIVDVDIFDLPGARQDAQGAWLRLTGGSELIWTPRNGGHWIATSATTIESLYRDAENFSNREIAVPTGSMLLPALPLMADGAEHKVHRAIIEPAFRPAALHRYQQKAREIAIELIDGFRPHGGCEFASEFGEVLPLVVFLTMMGLPIHDREALRVHARVMTHEASLEKRHAAFTAIIDYLEDKIAERRQRPGDDLLTRIVEGDVFGRAMTHEEVLGTASVLLFGGLDTVASMMGFVMHFLAGHPGHRKWIIETPSRRPAAIEEIMRHCGVASNLRTALGEVEIAGVTLRAGDHVLLPNCLHGLDPRRYDNPQEVDFSRPSGGSPTATFGYGPHRCLGNVLTRMEMSVLVEEWLARIPDFEIDPGEEVVQASGIVNGMLKLPLRWPIA